MGERFDMNWWCMVLYPFQCTLPLCALGFSQRYEP